MILEEGRNCWKIDHATKISFVIDGHDYFKALHETLQRAEKKIFILGWDFDTRIRLHRQTDETLGHFLKGLVRKNPALEVYILTWDCHFIYSFERQNPSVLISDLANEDRLHFRFDNTSALCCSHHQKVVVIDDALAFCGGLDITQRRWDTPDHVGDAKLIRRMDPTGAPYGPFHDVQIMLEGPVAKHLGELARQRWYFATGQKIQGQDGDPPASSNGSKWPERVKPVLENHPVAISRTLPEIHPLGEVKEIEKLYIDATLHAKKYIYIENQYISSRPMTQAIRQRLMEKDGPEIVIVAPCENTGLEFFVPHVLRSRTIRAMREADKYDRLRVYSPIVEGNVHLNLHSKVFIVDDVLARVGSANLTTRSFSVDTECDIALEAVSGSPQGAVVEGFRNDLLAEHLGTDPQTVANYIRAYGLIDGIERLRGNPRTLIPCPFDVPWLWEVLTPKGWYMDPDKPYESYFKKLFTGSNSRASLIKITALLIAVMAGLFLIWHWSGLHAWLNPRRLAALVKTWSQEPLAPLILIGGYCALSLLMVSINLLSLALALAIDPAHAFLYSLSGAVLGSVLLFWIGQRLGAESVRQLHGKTVDSIKDFISHREIVTVAVIRSLPLAPHWAVNLVLGGTGIRVIPFVIGTIIGLAPGIALISFVGDKAYEFIRHPLPATVILLVYIGIITWVSRRLKLQMKLRSQRAANGGQL